MIWTEESILKVKQLAEVEGWSARQIAVEFNVGRSSILGICHRKKITLKYARVNQHAEKDGVVKEKSIRFKPTQEAVMIAESYIPPVEQRKTIFELKNSSCRWPLGEPGAANFCFCGGDALASLPYCEHHSAIAYSNKREVYDPKRKSWGSI